MNINVNIRNKTKLVEILKGYAFKIHVLKLLTILDYKNWYKIKVETLPFNQNY